MLYFDKNTEVPTSNDNSSYCLTLQGKKLHLSYLLQAKNFRGRSNKDGALAAFRDLEEAGLGTVEKEASRRGTSAVSQRLITKLSI
jgi:hypothetical protein